MSSTATAEVVRARTIDEYIGQEPLKARLLLHINAALEERRNPDPILLYAPPGVGKTTLAEVIAGLLGDDFARFKMPMPVDVLLEFIHNWGGGVLLIDEIHAASKEMQEMLYDAMELGEVRGKSGLITNCRHITFIGATTETKIYKPLKDRFLLQPTFSDYSDDEMRQILEGMAKRAGVVLDDGVAAGLARASAGTPRLVGTLVMAARSLQTNGLPVTVDSVLDLTEIDVDGLTMQHLEYLRNLDKMGRMAGLSTMCTLMRMDRKDVESLEAMLLKHGYISPSGQGRVLTPKGSTKVPSHQVPTAERRARITT